MASRLLALCLAGLVAVTAQAEIDGKSGLVIAPGFDVVSVQCTVCHSGRLVAQNRSDREGWLAMIRWMQETQGLWPLGDQEEQILDYLSTQYGPVTVGRRRALPPELLPPGS